MKMRAAVLIALASIAAASSALAQSGGYKPYRPYEVKPYNPYELDKKHPEEPPKNPFALKPQTGTGLTPTVSAEETRKVNKYIHQYDPPAYRSPPASTYRPSEGHSYNKPSGGPNGRCYFSTCR